MSNAKDFPCLNKVWIVLCGEYDLPKDTPFPELPHPTKDMMVAESHAALLTMGQLGEWLGGKRLRTNPRLYEVMYDMWNELDNN